MSFIPLSPCCLQGGRLTGEPRGCFVPANDTQKVGRYHAKPSDGVIVDDKVALVLYTDAFGLGLPNPKVMADAFADQLKINVFVPEYISKSVMLSLCHENHHENPNKSKAIVTTDEADEMCVDLTFAVDPPPVDVYDPVAPLYPDQYAARSWGTTIYMIGEVLWKTWRWLPMLLFPKKQVPLAQASLNDLTSEGFEKVVAVGYCRGGAMVQYLLANQANTTLVGGIICHPSPEKSTWAGIDKPTKWHLADHDQMFGDKDIQLLKNTFQKKVDEDRSKFECVVHQDTVHGFAARPTLEHEPTKKAFDEANASAIDFCKKQLLARE
uniref:Dienelactone hydrolase domain-containing protein n=1 Tax=Kwoniella dejecticola CBS 10117 TaxID=1296121 RepID=A0A1A5ZWY2_9TREE|nr:uncharacterized protein I303_07079 [Kwoniella dejecticola CBS 10117]OBR82320.1 hypothetical protein I303_07079 [Kwoniella dejecticola CBS 10117]